MYTVKLSQLMKVDNVLASIQDLKLPIKGAFGLVKIKAKLEESSPFYREKIRELILDCAELDENGGLIQNQDSTGFKLKEGQEGKFFTEMGELDNLPVEIDGEKIPVSCLENEEISMNMLEILLPFIAE